MIALYAMTGAQLKEMSVPRTLLLAEDIGRVARETAAAHGDVVAAVQERISGFRLFQGKIVDIARRTDAGFAKAEAKLEGIGDSAGSTLGARASRTSISSPGSTARSPRPCPI